MDDDADETASGDIPYEEIEHATERVIERLMALAEELEPTERSVLAYLLAPAVDRSLHDEGDEVTGFSLGTSDMSAAVSSGVRSVGLRIIDADEPRR